MAEALDKLTEQLLAWIAAQPRTYAQVMDAWRTTCPSLRVWENAVADGLVQVQAGGVNLTLRGREWLASASRAR
jgi:hypothetical protein